MMSHRTRNLLVFPVVFAWMALSAFAQARMTVRHEVHHDVSLPLSEMIKSAPKLPASRHEAEPVRQIPLPPGLTTLREDPVLQRTVGPPTPAVGISFEGLGNGQHGFTPDAAPPDTNGAVGATQYVQWVNESFAVFNKSTGASLAGPTLGNTLWSGFGGGCQSNNDGDPVAIYDKISNRWVMSQFSVSTTPFLQCIAVSTTSDATGTYNRYSFQYNNFDDYPKMGVWPDAYYETFNMFNNSNAFVGSDACAYDRNAMLAGHAATQICFQQGSSVGGLLPSDLDGTTLPPTASPNYMVFFSSSSLKLFRFHVDFATPSNSTFTGPTTITVAAFTPLCGGGTCVPQPGTSTRLDSLADRLMYRLAYRNFGTHESLVLNHSVAANSGGGIRWYEIQNPSGTPSLAQQGTFAPDSKFRWMGSIAMDQAGNLAVGYSLSDSSSVHPSVAYAGRLATDPSGTLGAEVNVVTGTGSQTGVTQPLTRWGDYSAMTVDPVDDCTFWYTQEYMKTTGAFNWNTRIANFKFAGCGGGGGTPAVSLSPTSLKFAATVLSVPSAAKKVTLTNTGTGTLNISTIAATGDFHIKSKTCGSTVAVGASCTVSVTFTPTLIGNRTGSLIFTDDAPTSPQSIPLSGTGVSISFTPKTTNYGTVTVGSTLSKNITVSNLGTGAVAFTAFSIVGLNPGDFHITGNSCGATLAAAQTCVVTVQFKPTAAGTRKGTLKVTDTGAGTASQTATLVGVGG
jgi:hypothetical protein